MAAHPTGDHLADPRGFLRRAGANWSNFFFKPGDPTTLGLMRIFSGLFILYLHLAYSNDLSMFFSKDGIADEVLADRMRTEYPFLPYPSDWNDLRPYVSPPIDERKQVEFLDWMNRLPNTVEARQQALRFLMNLPDEQEPALQVLTFADRLPESEADRAGQLAKLIDLPKDEIERNRLIPPHLQDPDVNHRKEARDDIERLFATFRTEKQRHTVLSFLEEQVRARYRQLKRSDPADERIRTVRYLTGGDRPEDRDKVLPLDPKERAEVLDYMSRWGIDKRQAYAMGNYTWSIYYHVKDPRAIRAIHIGVLTVMALFTVGLFTRLTSVLTWVGVMMYVQRTTQVLFGMDAMMNIGLFYLTIGPSGAALSLDRLIERWRAAREIQRRRLVGEPTADLEPLLAGPRLLPSATFATRCIQIHFCFIYMASGLSKLKGTAWWNQTALWGTLYNPEFAPTVFGPYRWLMGKLASIRPLWSFAMSAGVVYTLVLEIGFPFLVWRPRLRPYMIIAATLLHTGIAVFMGLTVFGLFMLVLLMAYIPPHTVRYWLGQRRDTLPKLAYRFCPKDPAHGRKAAIVKALDVWNQVEFVELLRADGPPTLTTRDGGKPLSLTGLGLFRPFVFRS